ncbi:MAG TPA: phosphopyruvate hydratase [Negativicutes bacterium]|uniref:Enolase n=1 Tax=Candidatus Staskawiczbacteria bacterium RIFCSPHIGHO2_01_FULL_41_41 TaxID=1802203 RepID=A0A1G2HVC8_9BACT|nr:MAG: phosphopyruvate hydratase [Candidatus Staskawiczbacteria bacterium RIFCSPHIGHO2_01_FULL_41_41]OGZ68319.1 MAG: phosphopyruvate hydratase [Candidatus Staskawiczbacteria bacterium RIFCSPHIGHO2_02_FULL_43_16]OGZ75110.1 MAG: phosphopyruvate hydratase [Candidatus Staskawiczbacteria bacterium RIFCSPLOWO2_01_FULL_43_17b]HLD70549.1 phosphopyruvate hydratase [Negativicutes bacterium]
MSKITEIIAKEIKDSRGKPTVEVHLTTKDGTFVASCPSGASTGIHEALELRDDDGRGVSKAIANVNEIIAPKLIGKDPSNQKELDELMLALDGTPNKSKLGANAILPVSMAVCRSGAAAKKISLYQHLADIAGFKIQDLGFKMPLPSFNILNGGAHAKNELELQEFMVVPMKKTFQENLVLGSEVFNKLTELLKQTPAGVPEMGDEGGYAPQIATAEQALMLIKSAIGDHKDVKIALDCAASEFYRDGKYEVEEGKALSRNEMIDFYKDIVVRYPIVSIEDAFAEEDWNGFQEIRKALPETIIIGDDLTTTNVIKIKEAESKKACNGIIIKVNQIGTVSETIDAVKLAQSYGWKIMVSHRSGETMDSFIADLAVGVGADFIKSGAYTKDVRIVKYDRLLAIEQELNKK